MSGEHFGSTSSVRASCSASLQTFGTFFVPQQMSQMSIRFLVLAGSYCSCSRAHLHVYEAQSSMSLPPRPLRSTRSYRPQTCPLLVVARLQVQRASVPERQQQLPFIKPWELLLPLSQRSSLAQEPTHCWRLTLRTHVARSVAKRSKW